MADSFVHLHNHSEYSMLDGAAKTKAMAEEAARLGQPAIGLTDHGYLFGAYDFYTNCKNAGVKPIIGLEAYVPPARRVLIVRRSCGVSRGSAPTT